MAASIALAVFSEPVKQTPSTRGSEASAAPTTGPVPGSNWITSSGIPAWTISRTASAAISGVASAGLASTALPVTSAAAICPVKMARGKFHGEMQVNTPSGCRASDASASAA